MSTEKFDEKQNCFENSASNCRKFTIYTSIYVLMVQNLNKKVESIFLFAKGFTAGKLTRVILSTILKQLLMP